MLTEMKVKRILDTVLFLGGLDNIIFMDHNSPLYQIRNLYCHPWAEL